MRKALILEKIMKTYIIPVVICIISSWATCVSAAENQTVSETGYLVAWGGEGSYYDKGQTIIPKGSDYVAVAAGMYHCLALRVNGSIIAWGGNEFGQCDVPSGHRYREIAAGFKYSLALTVDGELVAWGDNEHGQCNVPAGNDFTAISAGDHHNLALRVDGSMVGWGVQRDGRCDAPIGLEYPQAFSGGGHHSLALRSDGSLVAWGDCSRGKCEIPAGNHYIAISAGTHHNVAIKLPFVTIGNPGNPDDEHEDIRGGTYGAVPYVYRMGQYEVTAAQYCAFLNAVAVDDTYGLYDPCMAQGQTKYDTGCRILRHGEPGDYDYTVADDWAQRPVNYVNFWDACRFANWMHNGRPIGPQDVDSTEDGAYTLNGYRGDDGRWITRNPDARVWVPSADEWYKAAYHKNDGVTNNYWDYPTGSDDQPSNELLEPDPGNNANYCIDYTIFTIGPPYFRTEVGEFENSASPYGTYDQAGNMREWTDSIQAIWGPDSTSRIQHGCSYATRYVPSRSDEMGGHGWGPEVPTSFVGFRVAAESPQAEEQ